MPEQGVPCRRPRDTGHGLFGAGDDGGDPVRAEDGDGADGQGVDVGGGGVAEPHRRVLGVADLGGGGPGGAVPPDHRVSTSTPVGGWIASGVITSCGSPSPPRIT